MPPKGFLAELLVSLRQYRFIYMSDRIRALSQKSLQNHRFLSFHTSVSDSNQVACNACGVFCSHRRITLPPSLQECAYDASLKDVYQVAVSCACASPFWLTFILMLLYVLHVAYDLEDVFCVKQDQVETFHTKVDAFCLILIVFVDMQYLLRLRMNQIRDQIGTLSHL